jgi:hypothetical protein
MRWKIFFVFQRLFWSSPSIYSTYHNAWHWHEAVSKDSPQVVGHWTAEEGLTRPEERKARLLDSKSTGLDDLCRCRRLAVMLLWLTYVDRAVFIWKPKVMRSRLLALSCSQLELWVSNLRYYLTAEYKRRNETEIKRSICWHWRGSVRIWERKTPCRSSDKPPATAVSAGVVVDY